MIAQFKINIIALLLTFYNMVGETLRPFKPNTVRAILSVNSIEVSTLGVQENQYELGRKNGGMTR